MSNQIIALVKTNQNIPRKDLDLHKIKKDGNCLYRVLSKYFTNEENNYKVFRELIYEAAKNNKEAFRPFFYLQKKD